MKKTTAINYYKKIKSLLHDEEFIWVEHKLSQTPNEKLEAFWHIIVAGYPVSFALTNFVKLHDYIQDKAINYAEALTTFVTYPKLSSGILLEKTKWYELN